MWCAQWRVNDFAELNANGVFTTLDDGGQAVPPLAIEYGDGVTALHSQDLRAVARFLFIKRGLSLPVAGRKIESRHGCKWLEIEEFLRFGEKAAFHRSVFLADGLGKGLEFLLLLAVELGRNLDLHRDVKIAFARAVEVGHTLVF